MGGGADQLVVVCGGGISHYFANGWKIVRSSPPRSNYILSSAHSVANDVVRGFDARDQAGEG